MLMCVCKGARGWEGGCSIRLSTRVFGGAGRGQACKCVCSLNHTPYTAKCASYRQITPSEHRCISCTARRAFYNWVHLMHRQMRWYGPLLPPPSPWASPQPTGLLAVAAEAAQHRRGRLLPAKQDAACHLARRLATRQQVQHRCLAAAGRPHLTNKWVEPT